MLPNHPVQGDKLRISVSLDGAEPEGIAYETEGRSEEWKENVLANQALRTTIHEVKQTGKQALRITALDEGVVVDQIKVR